MSSYTAPVRWISLVFGLLCIHQDVQATMECNGYNFGMQALPQCALPWWQSNHFDTQTADLEPQLTDLISAAFQQFGLDLDDVQTELNNTLLPNSADPLRKLSETAALLEPYVLYAVMDAAEGFGMTKDDMSKLGLPESLAEKENMKSLYQNYFSKSCGVDPARSFITCLSDWMNGNCQAEDKGSVITNILTNMADYYCDNKAPKQEVLSMMNDDFGQVYADVAKFVGVYKNPDSPYVFDLSDGSLFLNPTALEEVGRIYMSTCGYLIEGLFGVDPSLNPNYGDGAYDGDGLWDGEAADQRDGTDFGGEYPVGDYSTSESFAGFGSILQMFDESSKDGVGVMIERLMTLESQFANCALRAWNQFEPGFFSDHERMFNHLKFMVRRYGELELSLEEPERGDIRHTVMIYGDPHMEAYKILNTITCPAHGSQTYLSNQYFKLIGTAEPACPDPACSMATYVTSVKLVFSGRNVLYMTERDGEMPSTELSSEDMLQKFTEKDDIKLERLGSVVRITDKKSGAVFLFSKFKHTYQITIRMGESVFDNSLGLLILGCPNPTDITAPTSGGLQRKKRDTECATACQKSPEEFRDTCVFDCKTTGDVEVANITVNVKAQEVLAEEKDDEIYTLYPTTTKATTTTTRKTTPRNVGDGGGSGVMFLPNLLLIGLLALLSFFM